MVMCSERGDGDGDAGGGGGRKRSRQKVEYLDTGALLLEFSVLRLALDLAIGLARRE